MPLLKKLSAALSVGAVTLALGACAGEGPPSAREGGVAGEAVVADGPAPDLAGLARMMQEAQQNATTAHVETTVEGELADATGLSGTITADVDHGTTIEDTSLQMSVDVAKGDLDMTLVDGTAYVRQGEPADDRYVSFSLDELADHPGSAPMLAPMDPLDSLDASALAAAMGDAVTSFEHTGTERQDGVEVDAYRLTADPTRIDGVLGGAHQPAVGRMGEITVDFTVDPAGLPLEVDVSTAVEGKQLVVRSTFSRWGEPVDVQAPRDQDVVPYSEISPEG